MLEQIAKALTELSTEGKTTIRSEANIGVYADEVAVYVQEVIRGLKCEYKIEDNDPHEVTIEILP